ncbi:protein qui-1 isoform X2 [Planococcus citri]
MNNEEIVQHTLQGDLETSKWAIPRVVKIFVSATRADFMEERKCLLENIGPDLQTMYDSTGLEVEIVDMHYGSTCDPLKDSVQFADHLQEISLYQQVSRGCYFLCLIGNDWQPAPLPLEMDNELYDNVKNVMFELNLDVHLLENSYVNSDNSSNYVLNQTFAIEADIIEKTTKAIREAAAVLSNRGYPVNSQLLHSAVEHQIQHALDLDPDHVIAVMREFTEDPDKTNYTEDRFLSFKNYLKSKIPSDSLIHLCVRWRTNGINPACAEHDTYLTIFQEAVMSVLQTRINESIEQKPEVNARNKAIQEVFKECLFHLAFYNQRLTVEESSVNWADSPLLNMIKTMILSATSKHGPIIIQGDHGAGKTSLLLTIYKSCEVWFKDTKPIRIIRFCGITPRSSYNLELLRIICEQLNLLLQPDGLCVPRDASFDPLYVYNWFQTLLKRYEYEATESQRNTLLLILIDDLHQLNPLDSDIVAALSWLPTTLPLNIHIICTTLYSPETLKMTPLQRERFRTSDLYIELPPVDTEKLENIITNELERLEEQFGEEAVVRFASFVTISEFGLSETEMLELLMPTTGGIDCVLRLEDGLFNFATYSVVKRAFSSLLMEKFMSGRLLLCWRHKLTYNVMRKRYLRSQEMQRTLHSEIVNLFFSEFSSNDSDEENGESKSPEPDQETEKQTPFQSCLPTNDVTYSLRHVEESWIHLLKAGDNIRMKELTLCNFDFLLASVRTISVSYLRSILEHARFYLLDRDVELIYYTVRKASDALTRDTLQLGAQIICWLRPVSDSSDLINRILLSAMAWCDGYTDPLLVPLTAWLQPPLPLYVKCVNCGVQVHKILPTPSAQHVVVLPVAGDPQLWHAMSNTLVHTFKGHSGAVLCLTITDDSQLLLTGSEDTSVIIWNLKTFEMKMKITEHIASVLCVTCALHNTVVVTGGEDSRIIITSLTNGEVLNKIDHHRGPVTQVLFTPIGDVLVSSSMDKSVCLWDLETFSLLNTINMASSVVTMKMSADSIFLSIACEDNQIYLHSVATGTFIHTLRGHKSKVTSICLANDNQRAMAGGTDSRVYVFDMRSGSLLRTITTTPHHALVTCVQATKNDDFLVTAGESRLAYWNFRDVGLIEFEKEAVLKQSSQNKRPHSVPISCIEISIDGTIAVTGAMDGLVNVWQLNSHELQSTMEGHSGPITCIAISPNGLFVVSGSEDTSARVWGLTIGVVVCSYTAHQSSITAVRVLSDSRRAISIDKLGTLAIWAADNGTKLFSARGPTHFLAVTNNMKYIICGDGDHCLQIWPVMTYREEERFNVSHSEEITCFALTYDSLHVITGSKDMSLKVWQVNGGKLAQVLVGHTDQVTCVSVAVTKKSIVVSGSWDTNLIIWDIDTGSDLHLLSGHLGHVTCVKLAGDGSLAVSGSDDKRVIVWDCERGVPLSTILLHVPILGLAMSSDVSRVIVHLYESQHLPIICLHNTPATYVKVPVYVAPAIEDLRPTAPKRPNRRLLKKDVSLDSYTWQRKYAHLTTSLMMAAVDERLKRRFSVSASMEEISTISSSKDPTMGSQGLGPEQAALAQSQHFDQLKALWNKKSPPRTRRHMHSLSKQNSRSSRHSTDNDDISSMAEEDAELSG